jgi:hypothetical protein
VIVVCLGLALWLLACDGRPEGFVMLLPGALWSRAGAVVKREAGGASSAEAAAPTVAPSVCRVDTRIAPRVACCCWE